MKKLVASIATGVIIAGSLLTTASAAEYNVQKGDNLWDIAQEHNTTVDELVEGNQLKTTVIQPKQKLFINETYMVERDDTLTGIGQEYNVSIDDVKEWNNLDSDLIVIGQELEIKGVNVDQDDYEPTPSSKERTSNKSSSNTASKSSKQENASQDSPEGIKVSVTATAYTAGCDGCSGITYTGVDLNANPNAKVIAVDPDVIPLGSKVYVEGYGYATAADIGSAIQGNKIDIHVPTKGEAFDWGVRTVNVTILSKQG